MDKDKIIPIFIAVGMISVFWYFSHGYSLIFTFVPAVPVALWLYFKTCYRSANNKIKLLPYYLLAVGFQLLHFAEEAVFGFDKKFGPLFGGKPYDHNVFIVFNMCAYFMFLMGGIAFYKGWKPLQMFALFFVIYGMLGNAVGHIAFCIMTGGYFPGIYTSIPNLILFPILIKKLISLNKNEI